MSDIDTLCVDTIRTPSIAAVRRAPLCYPGAPSSTALLARDRIALSIGYVSLLPSPALHFAKAIGSGERPPKSLMTDILLTPKRVRAARTPMARHPVVKDVKQAVEQSARSVDP